MGNPLNVHGKVVGFLPGDYYNVMLSNGMNEGKIYRYKAWSLIREKDVEREKNW